MILKYAECLEKKVNELKEVEKLKTTENACLTTGFQKLITTENSQDIETAPLVSRKEKLVVVAESKALRRAVIKPVMITKLKGLKLAETKGVASS